MFARFHNPLLSFTLLISLGTAALAPAFAQDPNTILKGGVNKAGFKGSDGAGAPSLSRQDLDRVGDPFSGAPHAALPMDDPGPNAILDAPQEAFQPLPGLPASKRKSFGLGAEQDEFSGPSLTAMPGGMGSMPARSAPPPQQTQNPNRNPGQPPMNAGKGQPDEEANLGWDEWHRRVAENIYQRWIGYNNAAFANSPDALLAKVSYTVTRDGQIQDVMFTQKSTNVMFNALILQVIKSFSGDKTLLQFPPGSRRVSIENFGTFSQNLHLPGGFRHVTGDAERVKVPAQQR
jgi:hypothetical protein